MIIGFFSIIYENNCICNTPSASINTPYRNHPVTHQVLLNLLKAYKRPNDKIHEMLKKGIYIWGDALQVEPFSIANALYGPSYISAESALAYRALIPEQVFAFVSMTTKPSKKFTNKIGNFEYKHQQGRICWRAFAWKKSN